MLTCIASIVVRPRRQHERLDRSDTENSGILERIMDKDGNTRFVLTDRQERRGRNVGRSIHQNCYICRKYLTPYGGTEYIQTTFRCSDCKMPLCKKDRSNPGIGRHKSCIDEHITSTCETVGCHGSERHYTNFPKEKQVQLVVNRKTRNMRLGRQAIV